MASLTIRQLDETIKQKLRLQAVHNGRSMEAEARAIFTRLFQNDSTVGIATRIQSIVQEVNLQQNDELQLPDRKAKKTQRKNPDFSDKAYG